MLYLVIISAILLIGFITFGLIKFGVLGSYSAYSAKWYTICPKISLWSIVTFVAAALLIPVLIELGEGNNFQFLGFFAPVYLIGVSLTPKWESDKHEHKYHMIFAILCAICGVAWCLFIAKTWWILLMVGLIWIVVGWMSDTLKSSLTLIGELIAFFSMYWSLMTIM